MALNRYRLPSSGTAGASPSFQSYTHLFSLRRPLPTSDSSALSTFAYTPDAADHGVAGDAHHTQFVSDVLATGTVFSVGNTIKLAVQGLEAHANNNLQVQLYVRIYDAGAGTELRSKVAQGVELGTSLAGRFLSTTVTNGYTTVAGDRLVVEVSVTGTPGGGGGVQGHNASLRWGANGAGGDLAESDGETGTTLNPWFEIQTTDAGPTAVSGSDTGAGSEAVSDVMAGLSASESGAGAETTATQAALSTAETGAGAGATETTATFSVADSGIGAEGQSVVVVAEVSSADTGAASEAQSVVVVAEVSAADTGAANDVVAGIEAGLAVAESVVGTETTALLVELSAADSGAGSEAVSDVMAGLSQADSGIGAEGQSVVVVGEVYSEPERPFAGGRVPKGRQRARIMRTYADIYEDPGQLVARRSKPVSRSARLAAFTEVESFPGLSARGVWRASFEPAPESEESVAALLSRRGLPSKAFLDWFMRDAA